MTIAVACLACCSCIRRIRGGLELTQKTAAAAPAAWLTPLAACAMLPDEPTTEPLRERAAAMYGPLIVAAAILLSIAGVVLFLHDLSEARSRKAFDRIFEEGNKRRR
jgi:hypothetical protein